MSDYSDWIDRPPCWGPNPENGQMMLDMSVEDFQANMRRVIAEAKAEALREAARALPGFPGIRTHGDAAKWLRDRAEASGREGERWIRHPETAETIDRLGREYGPEER